MTPMTFHCSRNSVTGCSSLHQFMHGLTFINYIYVFFFPFHSQDLLLPLLLGPLYPSSGVDSNWSVCRVLGSRTIGGGKSRLLPPIHEVLTGKHLLLWLVCDLFNNRPSRRRSGAEDLRWWKHNTASPPLIAAVTCQRCLSSARGHTSYFSLLSLMVGN